MSSSENQNWQRKIEQIETEIYTEDVKTEPVRPHRNIDRAKQIESWLNYAKTWFGELPQTGKLVVGVAGVMVGFSVLNSLLHLISTLVSIAILGFLLYVGYRYLARNKE
jgi:purine-cytosine permease-like protein